MNSAPARARKHAKDSRRRTIEERVFEDANFRLKVTDTQKKKKRKVVRDVSGKEIDQSQSINFLYASTTSDCD